MTTATQVLVIPVIVQPAEGATEHNKVRVSGTATAGAVVTIAKAGDPSHLHLKLVAAADGHWSGPFAENLPKGVHRIQAHQTLNGVVSPWSSPRTFTVI